MKPVHNKETLPSSLNGFCWLYLLYQEGGSEPTSLKYSRKLNMLDDDVVLFTVADKESSSSASLSSSGFPTPSSLCLPALRVELPPSPAAEDTHRLHRERRVWHVAAHISLCHKETFGSSFFGGNINWCLMVCEQAVDVTYDQRPEPEVPGAPSLLLCAPSHLSSSLFNS